VKPCTFDTIGKETPVWPNLRVRLNGCRRIEWWLHFCLIMSPTIGSAITRDRNNFRTVMNTHSTYLEPLMNYLQMSLFVPVARQHSKSHARNKRPFSLRSSLLTKPRQKPQVFEKNLRLTQSSKENQDRLCCTCKRAYICNGINLRANVWHLALLSMYRICQLELRVKNDQIIPQKPQMGALLIRELSLSGAHCVTARLHPCSVTERILSSIRF
jgi:hypothetical protein